MVPDKLLFNTHQLETELLGLSDLVQAGLADAVHAFVEGDTFLAGHVIESDEAVNHACYKLEVASLETIAAHNLSGVELRTAVAIPFIASELERIHDYAKGICRIAEFIDERPTDRVAADLRAMSVKARGMLRRATIAFFQRDVEAAVHIPTADEEVNHLYNKIYREAFTQIMMNPLLLEQLNCIIWVAHHLERTADRVTNICERTLFTVTGELSDMDNDESIMFSIR